MASIASTDRSFTEIERLNWTLSAITNVNRVLVRAQTESELFTGACKALTRRGLFALAWVGVPRDDKLRSVEIFAAAGRARDYLEDVKISWGDGPNGDGPTGRAVRSGAIQVNNKMDENIQFRPWRRKAAEFGLKSSFVLPIKLPADRLGCVLSIYSERLQAFGKSEIKLFEQLGADLEFGVDVLRTRAAYKTVLTQAEEQDRRLGIMGSVWENSAEGVMITDSDNKIISVNPSFSRLSGYMEDDVLGKDPSILASGRHQQSFFAEMWRSVAQHGHWQGDVVNRDRYGKEFTAWLNISAVKDRNGILMNHVGSFFDVTQERRAQQSLRREKLFSDSMMESMPGIIYFYDRHGHFLRWNKNFMQVSGYDAAEIAQMHPLDFFAVDQKPLLRQRIDEVMATGESSVEASLVTKDRRAIPYLFTGRRLTFDGAEFLVGVGVDISKRKAAETELSDYATRLQAISRQLLNVQESERRRLGRELHDTVGQELAAVNLNLSIVFNLLPAEAPVAMVGRLADSQSLLNEASQHLREVMVELRPPGLDDLGLIAALKDHALRVGRRAALRIAVTGTEPTPRLEPMVAIALFRIAQEALNNVVKHAHAARVSIDLRSRQNRLLLEIADDGAGFHHRLPGRRIESMGMMTMRERAEAIGGKVAVRSAIGKGTKILVTLPRAAASAAAP
jgi:PAS domain S-box-containing protein